jgi:hypothetical protein
MAGLVPAICFNHLVNALDSSSTAQAGDPVSGAV